MEVNNDIERINIEADATELNMAMVELLKLVKNPIKMTINEIIDIILPTLPTVQFIFGQKSIYQDVESLLTKALQHNISNDELLSAMINWLPNSKTGGKRYQMLEVPTVTNQSASTEFQDWKSKNAKIIRWNSYKWLNLNFIPKKVANRLDRLFPMQKTAEKTDIEDRREEIEQEPEQVFNYRTDREQIEDPFEHYYNENYNDGIEIEVENQKPPETTQVLSQNASSLLDIMREEVEEEKRLQERKRQKIMKKRD